MLEAELTASENRCSTKLTETNNLCWRMRKRKRSSTPTGVLELWVGVDMETGSSIGEQGAGQ